MDIGCGTGALTNAIASQANPESIVGCDPAEPLLEFARIHSEDSRVSFIQAGIGRLPRRVGGYGSVTSLLALNFFPNCDTAIGEMNSLAAPEGAVSACVWDYRDGMEFLRVFWDTAAEMDSAARVLDEGRRFPLCRPRALSDLFRAAGLRDVRCEPIEIRTVFSSFDDYWTPVLGGTGPAPTYVASLNPDQRIALAQALERKLQPGRSGEIQLSARAWAIRGTVS